MKTMVKPQPLQDSTTYYDILELHPDATTQEIRESYLKLKSAYNKDSPALYSLMSREETEQTLQDIESAYLVLSNPERRKEYDQRHGLLEASDPFLTTTPRHLQKLKTRNHFLDDEPTPPKRKNSSAESDDPFSGGEDILVAPSTDFTNPVPYKAAAASTERSPFENEGKETKTSSEVAEDSELDDLIHKELEWRGSFIRKIRESRHLSIEELADFTKISKKYLKAIEEEDYSKLPAPVYLRGFVIQLAKKLRIPSETVAAAYLARYLQACSSEDH